MASTGILGVFPNTLSVSLHSPKCCSNLSPSQFISSKSLFKLKKQTLISGIQIKQLKNPKLQTAPIIYAAQPNFLKVFQTVWKVGKDGIEAGTSFVPDSIPRPIARISITVIAVTLALFVLKSFLSTAFFVLAVMGLSYFTFIALNKDEGPKGGGGPGGEGTTSVEDSLEEARRIMDKYK
ncbi:uncharacterized protein LOC111371630 isoform X1 [Olea europaea var. sylvestris]|uniref:uncharacterized protein LOC111371630 isoform X1 n=1 Tax=Olea europaea var. sylvestris TaxID=158386 RepID=UPI000C1D3152|nr:uncharacterized protein LOC111371630 isoform X1 [Olea europaea var. sylvestris]XP_022849474.1 uncharacterized protein LOC111371630 isoform X1 [Olea europaea var. sylvestris]